MDREGGGKDREGGGRGRKRGLVSTRGDKVNV